MVAKIAFPHRVHDVLKYHEDKVKKGCAKCIGAAGYLREPQEMNFHQKLNGLKRRNALNDRAITNTIHVSLNFHPSEKLTDEALVEIVLAYMKALGFEKQPYLIYKHTDAGHPHLHILGSIIRPDGSRISTHDLQWIQGEKARKELELRFGLITPEGRQVSLDSPLTKGAPSPIFYGSSETKKSIEATVSSVYNMYMFTSLLEFNAALRQYNVRAEKVKKHQGCSNNRGLLYRILDENGKTVGKPIKSSSLSSKPTLQNLEGRFIANAQKKQAFKESVKAKIDSGLSTSPSSLQELTQALDKTGIYVVPLTDKDGHVHEISFVDNRSKVVFNGNDLGQTYSIDALQRRWVSLSPEGQVVLPSNEKGRVFESITPQKSSQIKKNTTLLDVRKPIGLLLDSPSPQENIPSELLRKNRKKKKRISGL